MRVSRRHFLITGVAGVTAAAIHARWIGPGRVTVTRHALGVPGRGPPLRLVQLSDLHLQEVGRHEEAVAEAVHALAPHLILLTGDSIDRSDRVRTLVDFLALLPRDAPGYATLGNWEHWAGIEPDALAAAYESRGVRLLVNRSVVVEHGARRLLLTGLDDATAGRPRPGDALGGVDRQPNHLLLAHSPAYRDRLVEGGVPVPSDGAPARSGPAMPGFAPEYMLSGHTHGGQVQLLGWAPLRPQGSGRYTEGWYRDARPHLYVSRGIGTSVLPIRFGAPPEVALFEWHLRE